jgi:hypothetical protein
MNAAAVSGFGFGFVGAMFRGVKVPRRCSAYALTNATPTSDEGEGGRGMAA